MTEDFSDVLMMLYHQGVFPMAESADDPQVMVIEPKMRGILPIHDLYISKSLKKRLKKRDYEIKIDTAFTNVIEQCAIPKEGRENTWINRPIKKGFESLHRQGHAHSLEIWQEGELVGGLYGLALGAIFCGESMFSNARDMSKIALVHLCALLKHFDYQLLDAQFITDHLKRFGAYEMPQSEYKHMLSLWAHEDRPFPTEYNPAWLDAFLNTKN
ncbi:MAG: leucyl/phenylalanyl-tRNA--protein transferase [Pseudomonadota bacterium]|jgi:leucyl/phenylalanyl-tRNA--protein transferase|nr:leucyl/phenylalanyl-tRNA--protein transferase [Alphaproteobacteria bacterium]MEC7701866.1 leucyl/phenylalanyl-tRNA--protein transferase [Pseudomonadota bacterium]MEC9235433.1 leucyl/phenylalanyl-tRNA--protein transferase [Pseudomonadota bacterium]MEE3322510.1 leucyl/phenylalanyl-tRNA--protein transferase [Pseudomonadota bacterium]